MHGTPASKRRAALQRARGFTVVELMVVVFVAAILSALALPNMRRFIASHELTTTSNAVVSALATARMEAIKRNRPVQVCSNDAGRNANAAHAALGTECGAAAGAVYALDANGGAVQILASPLADSSRLQLTAPMAAIQFDPNGLGHEVGATQPFNGDVLDLCSTRFSTGNHRLISLRNGSSVTTRNGDGACS